MKVLFEDLTIETKGENDMVDITDNLIQLLNQVNIHNGLLTIFVPGYTAALITIEYEPGLKIDFHSALKRLSQMISHMNMIILGMMEMVIAMLKLH